MPATINGIGTHYYGKKQREVRNGNCEFCRRFVTLESYDTRLWFVFLFLPILPLGRKRIIDQCPACSRHRVIKKDEWESAKKNTIAASIQKYEAQPSPEIALRFHAQLLAFHMFEEARRFREEAQYQFPDAVAMMAEMATDLDAMSRPEEAEPLYEAAWRLKPDLPAVRIGMGRVRIRAGRLDEARELLRFLEEPGASQMHSLAPLEELAQAYQRAGKHEQTLELARLIIAELPEVARARPFRRFVAVSEKAVGQGGSILPRQRFALRDLFSSRSTSHAPWQRRVVLTTLAVAVIAAILAMTNEYQRRNRLLRVINALGAPVDITIDDQPPRQVATYAEFKVPEGTHTIKYSGAINEELTVQLQTGYFQRWLSKPVWILNPGGAAAIYHQTIFYQVVPTVQPETTWYLGEPFIFFPHVDYRFKQPPDTLQLDNERQIRKKSHINSVDLTPAQLIYLAAEVRPIVTAMQLAEQRLQQRPQDSELLTAYGEVASQGQQLPRAIAFLKQGLWNELLSIPWHRRYMQLISDRQDFEELAQHYDQRLQAQPNQVEWLYLKGVARNGNLESVEYLTRAQQADPKFPWPYVELAWAAAERADWAEALQHVDQATSLGVSASVLSQIRGMALLANGKTETIINENLSHLASNSASVIANIIQICEARIVSGDTQRARQDFGSFKSRLMASGGMSDQVSTYEGILAYMAQDFARVPRPSIPGDRSDLYFQAQLMLQTPQAIADDPVHAASLLNSWNQLALAIAFHTAGNRERALEWIEKAGQGMNESDILEFTIRPLLLESELPDAAELKQLPVNPPWKSLLLCALAIRFPDQQQEYCDFAARLNVGRQAPYHLVQRLTSQILEN